MTGDKQTGGQGVPMDKAAAGNALEKWYVRIKNSLGKDLPSKADIDALIAAGLDTQRVIAKLKRAKDAAVVQAELQELARNRLPLSMVTPKENGGARPVWELQEPSQRWTLIIDETGEAFDTDELGFVGKYAAILVPESCVLPQFDGFHASEARPRDIDAVIQALLDHPVGVFGLDVSASEARSFETNVWIQGVLEIVHWILRLMPLGDDATHLSIIVEQRGSFHKQGLEAAREAIRRSLAREHPARADRIVIDDFRFVDKNDKRTAYADALAHTFAARRQDARARLRSSGLGHALVVESSVTTRDYDRVMAGDEVPADVWQKLVRQGTSLHPLGTLLRDMISGRCREDVDVWRSLLAETAKGLDNPRRNLNQVGREVRWLEACRPTGEQLDPRMELVWCTVTLAESNHRGLVAKEEVERIRRLGSLLLDEDVRLVADAELHAAVTLTNLFDFHRAARVVARWHDGDRRALGRKLFGRLLSTRGQHEAFAGRNTEALAFFNQAIAEFGAMLDQTDAKRELEQTRSYRGFVLMDLQLERGLSPDEVELLRDDVLLLAGPARESLANGKVSFEIDNDGPTPYQWHFFFRYLATFFNNAGAGDISKLPAECEEETWQWPWPIIQAYCASRFWLHGHHEDARARLKHALELARMPPQGPTVKAIAVAIEMAADAAGWGIAVDGAARTAIESELPLATARFKNVVLGNDFVANLRMLLPFNFR
jgi:hypothetical protein